MLSPQIIEIEQKIKECSFEDKQWLLEQLHKHLESLKEKEILANFKELQKAIATGTAKRGTVEDLIADLNED
jgi:glutamate synthase domain-containing protein 3